MIDQIKITPFSSVNEAMLAINNGRIKIALVVDENDSLIGTITDGDIRRGLLQGLGMEDSIQSIYFHHPTFCTIDDSRDTVLHTALDRNLQQIPIVDHRGRVVRIDELNELVRPKYRSNKVVIMAGGLGKRLRPLTDETPKPMLKVGEKPILVRILENCKNSGFTEFIFCLNYHSHVIKNYFQDGSYWGVRIQYLEEEERMGTAGALGLAVDYLHEPFLVMNGDLLTDLDFSRLLDFHLAEETTATMGVLEYEHQIPFGVVNIKDGLVQGIEEKPVQRHFVSAGIYAFSPEVVSFVPKNYNLDMPGLFHRLLQNNQKVSTFFLHENWLDVGRMHDLERARSEYESHYSNEDYQ